MNHLFSLVLGVFVATIGFNGLATVIDKFVEESHSVSLPKDALAKSLHQDSPDKSYAD
jgi:hypothetical protein